jgi:hypothetical protein
MGKGGGTQVVKNELPEWLRPHVEGNIDRAQQISNIGYTAYDGPDVAAFSPMQTAAMQNTNQMAQAFGMQAAPMSMPEPQTFGGGIQGYSSKPLMDHAINQLKENAPGQYAAIAGQFINPKTGAAPAAGPWGPQPEAGAGGGQKGNPNGYGQDFFVPNWKLER